MHLLGHVKGVMECWEKVVVDLAGNGHKQICGSPCRYDCKIRVSLSQLHMFGGFPQSICLILFTVVAHVLFF